MNSRIAWMIAGAIVLGALIVGATQLSAQRPDGPPGGMPGGIGMLFPGQSGRFVVARVQGDSIIILDTSTGDLYKAGPDDYKKYSERPKPGTPFLFRPPTDKEARPRDKETEREKDKGRPREKATREIEKDKLAPTRED